MKKYIATLFIGFVAFLSIQSCKKEKDEEPKIQTLEVIAPSPVNVTFKGNIISLGTSKILDYGFIYNSISSIDEITGTRVSMGNSPQEGDFTKEVKNLTFTNQYSSNMLYVRSYLTNEKGTVFGKIISVNIPVISATNVSPNSGKAGDLVTINGQFYTSSPDQVNVTFNNIKAKVTEASSSKIVVEVPAGISAAHNTQIPLQITIGGQRVNASYYFVMLANVKDYSPKSGSVGTAINFTGENMPNYYSGSNIRVLFGTTEGYVSYNSNGGMQVVVPTNVTTEKLPVSVIINGQTNLLPGEFTLVPPTITSLSPTSGLPGTNITVNGTNFPLGSYGTNPVVMLGSTVLSLNSLSYTAMFAVVPTNMAPGEYAFTLKVGPHTVTAPQKFTVIAPSVTGFSPTSGGPGREVNISGNFLSGSYYNVYFGSVSASGQATSSSNIRTYVPSNIDAGKVKISVQYNNQNIQAKDDFTITSPSIDSFTPASGVAGTIINIYGEGFGSNMYGSVSVRFGSINATLVSVTDNLIRAMVPSNLNLGAMKISVTSNGQTVVSTSNFTATN